MKHRGRLLAVCLLLCGALACVAPGAVFADGYTVSQETYSQEVTASTLHMAARTSYTTSEYGQVIRVKSSDTSVATASADSSGRVIVTAVGSGNATVSFWYKSSYYDADNDWTLLHMPVNVAGTSSTIEDTQEQILGVTFPQPTITMTVGETQTITGLKLNVNPVEADELVWFTPSLAVLSVNTDTGEFGALQAGTATLYAVTKDGSWSGCVTVVVN